MFRGVLYGTTKSLIIKLDFGGKNTIRWRIIMANLWDDLKKNLNQWSSVAVEKAEEISKIAVAKTEELTKISKIKIEIRQLQRDIDKTYEELGRQVRNSTNEKQFDLTGNDQIAVLLGKFNDIESIISEKESLIQKIKEEANIKETDIKQDADNVVEDPVTTKKEPAPKATKAKTKPRKKPAKKSTK